MNWVGNLWIALGSVPRPGRPWLAMIVVAIAGPGLFAACSESTTGSEGRTPETTPGLTLAAVAAEAGEVFGLESLAVWHDGELVVEEYLTGGPETRRDVRSVTKSITSLLVGIAMDDESLGPLDQPIGDVLPEIGPAFGAEKASVRLRDLLTMSAGLEWDEEELDGYLDWHGSPDPVADYLEQPVVAEPGQRFRYASGGSHLLGRLIEASTGVELDSYAEQRLFAPLGIDSADWERLADGSVNAASGLDLRTADLVRIGRLVLDNGRWAEQPVVSESWIDAATTAQISGSDGTAYGFQWWIADEPFSVALASGYGGQTLAVAPDLDLVVVATGAWNIPAARADRQTDAIRDFLLGRLLPAVVGDGATG